MKMFLCIVVYLVSVVFVDVQTGPVENLTKVTSDISCSFRSLTCRENSGNTRCLKPSEICDGNKNCQSGGDELTCDKELTHFILNPRLQSTLQAGEDFALEDVSQEACAKFCREHEKFQCAGFMHNLQTNQCRLLNGKFVEQTAKPSIRGFWTAFQLQKLNSSTIPATNNDPAPAFDDLKAPRDAVVDDDLEAVIVEVDLDSLPPERTKRQLGNSLSNILGSISNRFLGRSAATNDEQDASENFRMAKCGSRSIQFEPPRGRNGRIINGVTAPYGAYPWQVAIKQKVGDKLKHICGGAIITSRHILTAAHCVNPFRRDDLVIVVGEYETDNENTDEQVFQVEQFISHYNYKRSNRHGDDIALIKLRTVNDKGIVYGNNIQPICLPTSESVYQPGLWCSATGWGMETPGDKTSLAKVLKAASVPILSEETCTRKEVYGGNSAFESLTEGMICAGFLEGGIDACGGDSGGPLACNVNGQFQLLGLVSWGEGCAAKNKPGVYVKVFHYLSWIQEWIRKL